MNVPEVDLADFSAAHAEGVTVIDVREPGEYTAGHVPGAILIPMSEVVGRLGEVPRGRPVYVICEMGARSQRAAQFYRARGIDARNVAGGTRAWIDGGLRSVGGMDPG